MGVLVAPRPRQHLVLSGFQILAILTGVVVISHCCSNLHFFDDTCCGAYFHLSISRLYISFDEASVKDFCPFFNWVLCSFIVEFNVLVSTHNCSLEGGRPDSQSSWFAIREIKCQSWNSSGDQRVPGLSWFMSLPQPPPPLKCWKRNPQ